MNIKNAACAQSESRKSQHLYGAFGSALSDSLHVLRTVRFSRDTGFHT